MPFQSEPFVVSRQQQGELEEITRSQSLPAGFVLRAGIIVLLADGLYYAAVADKLDCSTPTVGKWKKRFLEHGLDGMETHRIIHLTGQYENNRAEVSHQQSREQERQMRRFKSAALVQRFLLVHGPIHNLSRVGRHHLKAGRSIIGSSGIELSMTGRRRRMFAEKEKGRAHFRAKPPRGH